MAKTPKLKLRDTADIPLREVSGLASTGRRLLAVGDHDPVVFAAELERWPLRWKGVDLVGLQLPEGGTQFEALEVVDDHTVRPGRPAATGHLAAGRARRTSTAAGMAG